MTNDFYLYRHAWISAPYYDCQLTDNQCKELLKKGGWMVRNTFDINCNTPTDFWYIIKDSYNGMEDVPKKDRKFVLRALEMMDFKIIDKKIIENEGYEIVKKAYDSFVVKDRRMNRNIFKENLNNWDEQNHEFWGVFDKKDGKLVGFSVVKVFESGRFYDTAWILPEYKNDYHAYYGLCYKRNEYYLGELGLKYVTDGSRSVTEHSNVQPFLQQKFKFRRVYCKMKIHYKWWFGLVVKMLYPFKNLISNSSVKAMLKLHELGLKSQ